MTASAAIRSCTLGDVADVLVSGVDKKTKPGEIPVRLCNYTDVYYNWTIREDMRQGFMQASAREEEIAKFRLHAGQVALTKDSETREDIGHPTFISADFEDVILGYHCALISPHDGELDGQYLNALLCTRYAAEYFSRNAGGSGQRYYLSDSSIKDLPLFLPDFPAQQRIAALLGSLDEKIALNRRKIAALEALAKLIYDRWFVEFNFPDAHGRPYKENGGKMVWNTELKQYVPDEWVAESVADCGRFHRGVAYNRNDEISRDSEGAISVFRGNNISGGHIVTDSNEVFIPRVQVDDSQLLHKGNVLIAMSSGSKEHVGKTGIVTSDFPPRAFGAFCVCFEPEPDRRSLIYNYFGGVAYHEYIQRICSGTGINNLKLDDFNRKVLAVPKDKSILSSFNNMADPVFEAIAICDQQMADLRQLRNWLLPLLMNGQVEVAG